jgi:hypothetical protein
VGIELARSRSGRTRGVEGGAEKMAEIPTLPTDLSSPQTSQTREGWAPPQNTFRRGWPTCNVPRLQPVLRSGAFGYVFGLVVVSVLLVGFI